MGFQILNFQDAGVNPQSGVNLTFTPIRIPNISGSFLVMGDPISFTSDATGSISASFVSGYYNVSMDTSEHSTNFVYYVDTGSNSGVVSASLGSGSAPGVFFNLEDLVNDPFAIDTVNLSPASNYPRLWSGSIITLATTSSLTDNIGFAKWNVLVPQTYEVDCISSITTTTFFISVPNFLSGSGDGSWNAKDLLVVKPSQGIAVKLNNADNSYVLTVSSSDARYLQADPNSVNPFTSSWSLTSDFALVAGVAIVTSASVGFASSSVSSSYALNADTSSLALNSNNSNLAISSSYSLFAQTFPAVLVSGSLYQITSSYSLVSQTASFLLGTSYPVTTSVSLTSFSSSYALFAQTVPAVLPSGSHQQITSSVADKATTSSFSLTDANWTQDGFGGQTNTTDHVFIKRGGVTQFDGNNNALLDSAGVGSVLFDIRALDDHLATSALDWDNRQLKDTSGATVLDWSNSNKISASFAKTASFLTANQTFRGTSSFSGGPISLGGVSNAGLDSFMLLGTDGNVNVAGYTVGNGLSSTGFTLSVASAPTASYLNATASFAKTASVALFSLVSVSGSFASSSISASYILASNVSGTVSSASVAISSITSSLSINALTASLANTASFVLTAISASVSNTASFVNTAKTASYVSSANVDGVVLNSIFAASAGTANDADHIGMSDPDPSNTYYFLTTNVPFAGYEDVYDQQVLTIKDNQITANGGLTASVFGSSSWSDNTLSASYSLFASTMPGVLTSGSTYQITSSRATNSNNADLATSASYSLIANSSSLANTSSYSLLAQTLLGSIQSASNASTASYILQAVSSSYSKTSDTASLLVRQNGTAVIVVNAANTNTAIADTNGQFIIQYNSAAQRLSFFDANNNLVGLNTGSAWTFSSLTSSLLGTASYAISSLSAQVANTLSVVPTAAKSSSWASSSLSSSVSVNSTSASYATKTPNADIAGYAIFAGEASEADTASFIDPNAVIQVAGYRVSAPFTNTYNSDFTMSNSDDGKLVVVNNSSTVKVWLTGSLSNTFNSTLYQSGSGLITFITSSTSVVLKNRQNKTGSAGQDALVTLLRVPSLAFILGGDV